MEPDQVPRLVAELAEGAGLRDVELFLVDRRQVQLSSLTSSERYAVDGTLIGDTYRRRRHHVVEEDGGAQRVYAPLVDGEDRLGVLSALVDDASAAADDLSPAETVRRLIIRLYEHSPAPLHDDATMLLVNWRKSDDSDAD